MDKMDKTKVKETFEDNPTCPYCGHEEEDAWELDHDQDSHNLIECGNCEKTFIAAVSITVNWYGRPADCLNGSPHKWEATHTFPVEFTRMRCESCYEERTPTKEEWKEIYKNRNLTG